MSKRSVMTALTLGCLLTGVRCGWAQSPGGFSLGTDLGNLGSLGLNPGMVGGGEVMPGAVLVKLRGEVQCVDCTLEEMGIEEAPGDLYQFSYENTHLVIKVASATPDIVWQMVERHKLFLRAGEDPAQLKRLISESAPGKRIEVTAGVAPEQGDLIPLMVKVK